MPVLKQEQLSEEARHDVIGGAIVAGPPSLPGYEIRRDFTPLVVAALQRARNPFIVGREAFISIGIEFDAKGKQLTSPSQFAIAMMPKTAEVLLLLTCEREKLKEYAVNPVLLESDSLDVVEDSTMEAMAQAMIFISDRLKISQVSRAVPDPKDKKPDAAGKGGGSRPKKPVRTGSARF